MIATTPWVAEASAATRDGRTVTGFAAKGEPGTEARARLPKVVFSSTLSEPVSWPNTHLVAEDAISNRTFDARIQLLEYVPTILGRGPGPAE